MPQLYVNLSNPLVATPISVLHSAKFSQMKLRLPNCVSNSFDFLWVNPKLCNVEFTKFMYTYSPIELDIYARLYQSELYSNEKNPVILILNFEMKKVLCYGNPFTSTGMHSSNGWGIFNKTRSRKHSLCYIEKGRWDDDFVAGF